jgi:hypothetical protein
MCQGSAIEAVRDEAAHFAMHGSPAVTCGDMV